MKDDIIGTTGKLVDLFNDELTKEEWNALCIVHKLKNRLNLGIRFDWEKSIDVKSVNYSQIIDEDVFLEKQDKCLYIIEQRLTDGTTEDSDCFISYSMNSVINWINQNKDFDTDRDDWYWVVLKTQIDVEYSTELYKVFDKEGNELKNQPIK